MSIPLWYHCCCELTITGHQYSVNCYHKQTVIFVFAAISCLSLLEVICCTLPVIYISITVTITNCLTPSWAIHCHPSQLWVIHWCWELSIITAIVEDCWRHSEPRDIRVTVICWTKWGVVVCLWSDSSNQKAITVTHSIHIHRILFDRESYWCLSGGFLRKGQSCPRLSQDDHPLQYVGCFLSPSQAVHRRPSQLQVVDKEIKKP